MRVCPVSELQPGMILGKSLFNENGQLLLRAGYALDKEVLALLKRTGRTAVYILEEGTEDIVPEDLVSEECRSRAVKAFQDTARQVAEAVAFRPDIPHNKMLTVMKRGAEFRNVVPVDRVAAEITDMVGQILDAGRETLNQLLLKSAANFFAEHALDTALLAVLVGRRLNFPRAALVELGVGAFLHDLGKLALPTLLTKPESAFSDTERSMMREHPVFGTELLAASTDRFFMARAAVMQHHERQDGLGYPQGFFGQNRQPVLDGQRQPKEIFPFAEIIAVADAYDNLISSRNGSPMSPEQALRELARQSRSAFNAAVVALFSEIICIYPVGALVRIVECSTPAFCGYTAAIMKTNSTNPHLPLVVFLRDARGQKITPRITDLAQESHVRLELIL